jgi:DNA-binding beta-propeller fold protein YncE
VPSFEIDPHWPLPLPNNWIIGQVSGVAVDSRDHVWIVHRPGSLTPNEIGSAQDPPISACCDPAPPVIEFDQEGNVVQAWGGPETHDPWPNAEHGIFVDHRDNVWIASSGASADVVLKFNRDGERLLQIGEFGETGGSENTTLLGGPTDIAVDPETNEVYISDGYGNRRLIVFDAESGEYKRHWGAYGETPDDGELEPYDSDAEPLGTYRTPVHSVRISNDGLVYVSDRVGNRFQMFQKNGEYVTEKFIETQTLSMGSVWDIDFSPGSEQTYLYVADGTNNKVWILTRDSHEIVGEFGRNGRYAGQFHWLHSIAVDSFGNIYTGEVDTGMRVQRFVRR